MEDWKWKAGIAAIVVLVIIVLAFIIYQQNEIIQRQKYAEQSVVEMRMLRDDIVRHQSSYATKDDVEQIIKDAGVDLVVIKDDLKKLGGHIQAVSTLVSSTPGYYGTGLPSTVIVPGPAPEPIIVECQDGKQVECPNPDAYGYLNKFVMIEIDEPFSNGKQVPIGSAGFRAWEDNPWTVEVLPRKYQATTVLSQNDAGRHFAHSQLSIEVDGKRYQVPIDDAKLVEVLPTKRLRFAPRLYLGVDGGVIANPPTHADVIPNLQMSFLSYGHTKIDPSWTFLNAGVGYEAETKGVAILFSPANYNVGKPLPFVENLHVGPSLSIDPAANFGILLGMRVGL
jgi:hypothetical protein